MGFFSFLINKHCQKYTKKTPHAIKTFCIMTIREHIIDPQLPDQKHRNT